MCNLIEQSKDTLKKTMDSNANPSFSSARLYSALFTNIFRVAYCRLRWDENFIYNIETSYSANSI